MKSVYFSIIIPTLNEEKFLPKLLTDLKRQKEENFEIIVVDGNSEDLTKKIVVSFQKQLPNLSLFSVEKRNVSYQRNFGASKAKGNYLLFIDADSRISPNFLYGLKKEIVKTGFLFYIPSIKPQSYAYQDALLFNLANLIIELSQITNKPFSSGGNMIIEKNFFLFLGGFDEGLYLSEDHEIVQRAKKRGVSAKFLRNIKINFSLRRMQKEGRLEIFFKYILASIHLLTKGKIVKKIFEYQMGGALYNQKIKNNFSLDKFFRKQIKLFKKNVNTIISLQK